MESELRWRLRWAAAYLADRYYLNECRGTCSIDGYDVLDTYRSFSVDVALGFIALSRAIGNDSIERVCRKLLYTTLEFIDDQLILNKNIDDIDITVSWKLYKHYRTMSYRETKDGWLGEFAIVIFPFIFSDERVFAENGGSYELGRGIVETAVQLAPVAKRFGKMFGVDMS